ncbi:MAG: hypothetical protein Q9M94_02680 [Candidatus Gracilibacteria bacterium]|nr:hypothetical protein [Candidatus Gracilibacteria bacterium]
MIETVKKKGNSFKINPALILLIIVILITVGLYGYNTYIEGENKIITERIGERQTKIDNIKKDKNIQVYALITDNKKILDKLESYSQITRFINSVTYIEDNYDLILDGFSYSNGIVTTKAVTNPEKVSNAYIAVSDFIEKYRKDKKSDFKLPFISKVVGNGDMAFNLKLEVKENLINKK